MRIDKDEFLKSLEFIKAEALDIEHEAMKVYGAKDSIFDKYCYFEDFFKIFSSEKVKSLESKLDAERNDVLYMDKKLALAMQIIEKLEKSMDKLSKEGDGHCKDKKASFYDCLPTLQEEYSERRELARQTLKEVNEMKEGLR